MSGARTLVFLGRALKGSPVVATFPAFISPGENV